ncbi:MAG: hypothetical protein RKH07_15255 [Gammaproteobacteria bacterium]
MSTQLTTGQQQRESLLPVAITIFGMYLMIMSIGYFVGNML